MCPICNSPLRYGWWEIVGVVQFGTSQKVGWRGRWVPSKDLWCGQKHGPFVWTK